MGVGVEGHLTVEVDYFPLQSGQSASVKLVY